MDTTILLYILTGITGALGVVIFNVVIKYKHLNQELITLRNYHNQNGQVFDFRLTAIQEYLHTLDSGSKATDSPTLQ